ncbi:MAG: Na+/H+ antiporter NhaC family protein, partial [Acidobacteriota bacterium]
MKLAATAIRPTMLFLAAALAVLVVGLPAAAQEIKLETPEVLLKNIPFAVKVSAPASVEPVDVTVLVGGSVVARETLEPLGEVRVDDLRVTAKDQASVSVQVGGQTVATAEPRLYPGFVTILPPLVAIVLALIFREVVTSLFAGIWVGCLFLTGFDPIRAIFDAGNRFGRETLTDGDHVAIVLFTLMLGGMVGITTRMGGMRAVVEAVAPLATNRRRGKVATWLAGVIVFFDDYANSLIIGNTMRPLTDKLKISREKLAYIVDSTAAPVASLFLISTWIGYQLGLIGDGLELTASQSSTAPALAAQLRDTTAFEVFLQTIPYLFYPIFTLVMVGSVSILGRDFGPMLVAERRAAAGKGLFREGAQLAADIESDLEEAPNVPAGRWWNGLIPVAVLVLTVLWGLVSTGIAATPEGERSLYKIFGNADPYSPLLWGSTAACIAGLLLAGSQRILTLSGGIGAWGGGVRAMMMAIVILVLAWSLGDVTKALGTASFILEILSDTLPPGLLPATVFVVSAAIAFATGTSWTTMAILFPIVIPLAIALGGGIAPESAAAQAVVFGAIGSVLAGSIMGDHCSPISDTTVLSSTASSCDHVDHVRTQLPYAMLTGSVAVLVGNALTVLGVPVWISLLAGSALIV